MMVLCHHVKDKTNKGKLKEFVGAKALSK